ncbi:Crp/Fnr family transcriptional regulator [Sphingomonas sp. G-3-2-10]|uniref:Crp/Fnr family transcriptional regulator n=1 Tax=Sphingomonas sp. G-3-2-10 TaxID=2728838 RepID=UPI00146B7745|nr:Crp/Fnr family transcriptional regulator [Sphingomonas sp. G-3-2-10]NML06683.1 Crp/Fnr family transcriptional regulator [Sphingomonas sp. G-3-2-10]
MEAATICADCAVRDKALCGALNDAELEALNTLGRRRVLKRGETLIWAGEESAVCANLLSGVLKLAASTADGREQIVGLLYPADFVGKPYAGEAEFTVSAVSDAELCVFPRGPFEAVLEDHVRMERLLLQRTFAALEEARGRMLALGRLSASEKVAGFLLDMADRTGGCRATGFGPVTFDLPLTRGEMAEVLGLTIETVSRQLTKLKDAGTIALPGSRGVTIRDRQALEIAAQ